MHTRYVVLLGNNRYPRIDVAEVLLTGDLVQC